MNISGLSRNKMEPVTSYWLPVANRHELRRHRSTPQQNRLVSCYGLVRGKGGKDVMECVLRKIQPHLNEGSTFFHRMEENVAVRGIECYSSRWRACETHYACGPVHGCPQPAAPFAQNKTKVLVSYEVTAKKEWRCQKRQNNLDKRMDFNLLSNNAQDLWAITWSTYKWVSAKATNWFFPKEFSIKSLF